MKMSLQYKNIEIAQNGKTETMQALELRERIENMLANKVVGGRERILLGIALKHIDDRDYCREGRKKPRYPLGIIEQSVESVEKTLAGNKLGLPMVERRGD